MTFPSQLECSLTIAWNCVCALLIKGKDRKDFMKFHKLMRSCSRKCKISDDTCEPGVKRKLIKKRTKKTDKARGKCLKTANR